jgi:hypothetical protein
MASALVADEAVAQEQRRDVETTVSFVLRVSDISGEVDSEIDFDYGDLWGTGFGLAIETNYMFPMKKNWAIGPYISGGFDLFQGGDEVTDDVGDTLEADNLFTSSILFGVKAMLAPPRGFFFDGRFGVGPVFWSATEGEVTLSGTTFNLTIFDSSVTFAVEFGAHVGFSVPHAAFGLGFSVRSQGKPEEADLDFEGTESAVVASFELEVLLRF